MEQGYQIREAEGLGLWVVWFRDSSGHLVRFAGPFSSSAAAVAHLSALGVAALFPVEVRNG
jgi:hypothetical protein